MYKEMLCLLLDGLAYHEQQLQQQHQQDRKLIHSTPPTITMPVPVAVYTNMPRAGEGLTKELQPEYEGKSPLLYLDRMVLTKKWSRSLSPRTRRWLTCLPSSGLAAPKLWSLPVSSRTKTPTQSRQPLRRPRLASVLPVCRVPTWREPVSSCLLRARPCQRVRHRRARRVRIRPSLHGCSRRSWRAFELSSAWLSFVVNK